MYELNDELAYGISRSPLRHYPKSTILAYLKQVPADTTTPQEAYTLIAALIEADEAEAED